MTDNELKLLRKLFNLKSKLPSIIKNAKNTHFKNTYIELPNLLEILEEPFIQHALHLEQPQEMRDGMLCQVTRIIDIETGEFRESVIPIDLELAAHQVCGASTYYRRYGLLGLLGLAAEDDDGNTASEAPAHARQTNGKRKFGKQNNEFVNN